MSKVKMIVVGGSTLVTGLTLAGLQNSIISTKENFQENLETVIKNKEYGIVIIQEDLLSSIDWRMKKKLDSLPYPVFVTVPGLSGKSNKDDDLRKLIKRALGFDMMMQK